MISCAVISVRQAALNAGDVELAVVLDELHQVDRRQVARRVVQEHVFEHGLLALMRSVFGQVCHSLTVVSNCMPGSPQTQVPSAMPRIRSRAL